MSRVAVVVSDMWDTHWCKTLAAGTAALAFHVDAFLDDVRKAGGVVVHAPSQTERFYEGWPQYIAARSLRRPIPASRELGAEIALPAIEGCGCEGDQCASPEAAGMAWPWPWTSQHDRIKVADDDYIVCEDGEAAYGIFAGIQPARVVICGVHTDQCVLDRRYGMKAMWQAGIDVALVRDLTEASHPRRTREVVRAIGTVLPVVDSWDVL